MLLLAGGWLTWWSSSLVGVATEVAVLSMQTYRETFSAFCVMCMWMLFNAPPFMLLLCWLQVLQVTELLPWLQWTRWRITTNVSGILRLCHHQILSSGIAWKWKHLTSSFWYVLNWFPYLSVSVPNFTICLFQKVNYYNMGKWSLNYFPPSSNSLFWNNVCSVRVWNHEIWHRHINFNVNCFHLSYTTCKNLMIT